MNKFTTHFKKNKKVYITGGICLVVGAASAVLALRNPSDMNVDNKIQQILSWKPQATLEVHIEALGDPGNLIQDISTGVIYPSQGKAARDLGLDPARISDHLNGKLPDVKGYVFERLGKAHVSQ